MNLARLIYALAFAVERLVPHKLNWRARLFGALFQKLMNWGYRIDK